MEFVGFALSVANTLFASLRCTELREMLTMFKYESQLDELLETVSTVKAVLLDAENKQEELSHEAKLYIHKLRDVVYDADDLLDEFVTFAEQKQLKDGGKTFDKVLALSSRCYPFGVAYDMSQRLKNIRKKLNAVADNHNKFGLGVDSQPLRRREETYSDVCEGDVIGRKDDIEKIVAILSDGDHVREDVSFLSIVGMGGLGKTALAQLLFNDARVTSAFELKLWTCISDHDQKHLDIEGILYKILASSPGGKPEGLSKQEIQNQVREKLRSSKYLLVLDDVWTENRYHWLNLVECLSGGRRGSWIVVTTRSKETAKIVGDGLEYELQRLSKDSSWHLFRKVAIKSQQPNSTDDDLLKIGKKIAEKCAGNPLALKVIGSLLYGQDKTKWLSVQSMELANIKESEANIMPILKLSYHNLESPIKSCFSYCALYPKDFMINKDILISLWIAQGYIEPLEKNQSKEDAAEEYITILLRRCFFQDVEQDEFGDIISFKMHDLMHDIAQKVAGEEILISNSISNNADKKVRHLVFMKRTEFKKCSFIKMYTRSYLHMLDRQESIKIDQGYLKGLLANLTCVRALDLRCSNIKNLPSTIGELLHLRYLNLSYNEDLEELPKSIKKLYNLETLNLNSCSKLKKLPKHLNKLVKLRVLDIGCCKSLTCMPGDISMLSKLRVLEIIGCNLRCMPCGLGKLTSLQRLPEFVLIEASSSCKEWFDQLEDLKFLKNLKGRLSFQVRSPKIGQIAGSRREGGYLKNMEYLNGISFWFDQDEIDETAKITEEALMEELEPHCNLMRIELFGYHGVRMPNWVCNLSNLVKMELHWCVELVQLSCLGNLCNLKDLTLSNMEKLAYIIEKSSAQNSSFLPCLKSLKLNHFPKLKGWVKHGEQLVDNNKDMAQSQLLCFPQLKSLRINDCPELISLPLCPAVETLRFRGFNERLRITRMDNQRDEKGKATTSSTSPSLSSYHDNPSNSSSNTNIPKLREVVIQNVTWLKSFPIQSFQQLTSMSIINDNKVESFEEVKEVFSSCSSSLLELSIDDCLNLTSVCGGLRYLTALKKLSIDECPNLKLEEEEDDDEKIVVTQHSFSFFLSLFFAICSLILVYRRHKNDDEDDEKFVVTHHSFSFLLLWFFATWLIILVYRRHRKAKEEKGSIGMPWRSHSLRSLTLYRLPKLEQLPDWIQYLASLEKLAILRCKELQSLPAWMPKLTSLRELVLENCSEEVEKRCQNSTGEDWPNIQHISKIDIRRWGIGEIPPCPPLPPMLATPSRRF